MSVGKTLANKGFTLLELLVVLVIISLMSALVVPRLTGSLGRMNAKTAAKKIAASLRYARSQAASRKMTYLSDFDFEKNRVVIGRDEGRGARGEGQEERGHPEPGGVVYDLPEGVVLEKAMPGDVESGLFQIVFYPGGNSSGGNITIVDDQERRYKISADFITGTVQLTEN